MEIVVKKTKKITITTKNKKEMLLTITTNAHKLTTVTLPNILLS